MRYPEDKIKEAILHPDLDVRETAIRYFHTSTSPDDTLMPLAIQAIEQYGRKTSSSFAYYLHLLPQTEQTIGWVISELKRDNEGPPEEWHHYYVNMSHLLNHADIRMIAEHAIQIFQAPHFNPIERSALHERLDMLGWAPEKCWQALRQRCDAIHYKRSIDDSDLGQALRIIEALARQPHPYQDQIVSILTHDLHNWLRPFIATLAGEMRLQSAIPSLVCNLGHPNTFLSEQCQLALAKIATDEVVAIVCDQFHRTSREFRLSASELLCKIHSDLTVKRVLELLPGETDVAIRRYLCQALLDQFSFEAVEPTRHLIKHNKLTLDLRRLRGILISVSKIMGTRFPEFDAWQVEAARDAQRELADTQEVQKLAYEAGGDQKLFAEKLRTRLAERQAETKRLETELAKAKKLLARRSSSRASPEANVPDRIGRNDPCPCGSGRKFKTCCMRK